MEGYALTKAPSFDVVSAYASSRAQVPGVATTPGWRVIGTFFLPLDGDARLDVLGFVSSGGLTAKVRLFDLTSLQPVAGEVTFSGTTPARTLGARVSLSGQRNYQIQAECVGATGDDKFATIETVSLSE